MSKFKSLLDAHRAELEKQEASEQTPVVNAVAPMPVAPVAVDPGPVIVATPQTIVNVPQPQTVHIAPAVLTSSPAKWNPPYWVLIIFVGAVIGLIFFAMQKDPSIQKADSALGMKIPKHGAKP